MDLRRDRSPSAAPSAAAGQPSRLAQDRREHVAQTGVRQFHLRLDAHGVQHPAAVLAADGVLQQDRLARPRVAAQHQGPIGTAPDGLEEPVEELAFGVPVGQGAPAEGVRVAILRLHQARGGVEGRCR